MTIRGYVASWHYCALRCAGHRLTCIKRNREAVTRIKIAGSHEAPERGKLMYKNILVPVDGSETSRRGLEEGIRLATAMNGQLHLLHVVDESALTLSPEFSAGTGELIEAFVATGRKILGDAADMVRAAGVAVATHMPENVSGRVADVILNAAQQVKADVIVMGTHGRRGISHIVLGSDAETVVRSAPIPVLLVRAPGGKGS